MHTTCPGSGSVIKILYNHQTVYTHNATNSLSQTHRHSLINFFFHSFCIYHTNSAKVELFWQVFIFKADYKKGCTLILFYKEVWICLTSKARYFLGLSDGLQAGLFSVGLCVCLYNSIALFLCLCSCSCMKPQLGWWREPVQHAHTSSWTAVCAAAPRLEAEQVNMQCVCVCAFPSIFDM